MSSASWTIQTNIQGDVCVKIALDYFGKTAPRKKRQPQKVSLKWVFMTLSTLERDKLLRDECASKTESKHITRKNNDSNGLSITAVR